MEKIAVIGAGISGLSIGQLLKDKYHVLIFETESRAGGLVKCDIVNGSLFHRTGGHVFNTKRKDVYNWFWKHFDCDKEYVKALRNSSVFLSNDFIVPYPIENHVHCLHETIARSFIGDMLQISKEGDKKADNFKSFLINRFGKTLYDLYFKPYNYKVWRRDLSKVPLSWLEGKLPMPSVEEMIYNNMFHIEERKFVHSSFYYPKKGGSQFVADRLAEGLDICYGMKVDQFYRTGNKWKVNGLEFDKVIFCGNIKQIPALLADQLDLSAYCKYIDELEFHGTTSVFCEISPNPYSWIYLPNQDYESHRIICSGNFSDSNNLKGKMTGTVEFTDFISEEDIKENLRKMPLEPVYLTHHYEKYTYPIQDVKARLMIQSLKDLLGRYGVFLLGRFAEWEYYNMDVAMGAALDLSKKLSDEEN